MTNLHLITVVNATWFLATGRDVAGPKYLSTTIVPERQPLRTLSLRTGDVLRLRCDSTVASPFNATFAWLFNGLAIPSDPHPGLYQYKVVVVRQAGRHPHAAPYSTLDMGRCGAAHAGIYSCQILVGGMVVDELRFEVRVTASNRRETDSTAASGQDLLTRPERVPAALSFEGRPRPVARPWQSSPSPPVHGQACASDELCAATDPVSLCEGGVCICAPTFTLGNTQCIKYVGRYQRCGPQVVCRGNSMACNEGICECINMGIGERDDDCGDKSPRRPLNLMMIYTTIAVALFAIGFVLFYAFCQKRYDLDDELKGAFIVTCAIL